MGLSPGRALVPHRCAGTPAVDDTCTKGRTMTTGPASICGVNGANAGDDGKKSRDQKCPHLASPVILAQSRATPDRSLKFP
jgi:hypothetical protein